MTNFQLCSFLLSALAFAGICGQEVDSTTVTVDKLTISQLIDDTVASARKGIEATALINSLQTIQQLADAYLNERGAIVDAQDIVDALREITTKNKWQITLSTFLEDPLVQEERKVSAGLFVLSGLSLGMRAEDNDTHVNTLVAAVSFTAKSVGRSLTIGETLYNYNEGNIGSQEKRLTSFDIHIPRRYHGFHVRNQHNVDSRDIRLKRFSFSGSASVGGSVSGGKSGDGSASGSVSAAGGEAGSTSSSSSEGSSNSDSGSTSKSSAENSPGSSDSGTEKRYRIGFGRRSF